MKKEIIEQMLSSIDEAYLAETLDEKCRQKNKKENQTMRIRKIAAAAAVFVVILGTGITVTAATSDVFRNWLARIFGGHEITKVEIESVQPAKAPAEHTPADLPADENSHLSLTENTEIFGESESFICQYHMEDEDMIYDELYSVQDDGLKKLTMRRFQGQYDGVDFSFEYAIINHEIFGCNLDGDINAVFHYTDGETAYVELCETTDEVFTKGCIARINLKTGAVEKLTDDKTIGNMMMSPTGKIILINYRMDGYWAAFDIETRTERIIKEIDGYAHTHQVIFQDDTHVLTFGDTYKKNGVVMTGTQVIDLTTGQRTASYKDCGDPNPMWVLQHKKNALTIQHVDGTASVQIDGVKDYPHWLSFRGDYVLLRDLQKEKSPYYLCNLKQKTHMTIKPPAALKGEVEIYLAAKEGKILMTDGKEAYLVDVSSLG